MNKEEVVIIRIRGFHAKIRCNLNDISYLCETQKNLSILKCTPSEDSVQPGPKFNLIRFSTQRSEES